MTSKHQVADTTAAYSATAKAENIPKGYKQTEEGVIPEDWIVTTISRRHDLATGNTPPTADMSNYGNEFLFVSPADLGEKKYIRETEKRLSAKGFRLARKFPAGSTLFTCIGSTIGKTGFAFIELTSNQQINAVFPNKEDDSEFTYYALSYISPKVKMMAGEQAVPIINKTEFGETTYCQPSRKEEQTAIANALSDVDALITELEKLITKKQTIKTAAMQQLLTGRTRLPQFALREDGMPKGYKPSELGEVPEDWDIRKTSSFSSFITKGSTPTTYGFSWEKDGVLFLRSECVSSNGLDLSESRFISESAHKMLNRSEICAGDILITITGNVGRVIQLPKFIHIANINQHIARIRVISVDVISSYIFHFLSQDVVMYELNKITTGQAYPQLSLEQIRNINVLLPNKEEQTAIATILTDMDEEIQVMQQRLNKTRQIKQGMMQELLTGKTRLVQGSKCA